MATIGTETLRKKDTLFAGHLIDLQDVRCPVLDFLPLRNVMLQVLAWLVSVFMKLQLLADQRPWACAAVSIELQRKRPV